MIALITLILVSILLLIELGSLVLILTNVTLRSRLFDLMGIRKKSLENNPEDLRCEDVCCGGYEKETESFPE